MSYGNVDQITADKTTKLAKIWSIVAIVGITITVGVLCITGIVTTNINAEKEIRLQEIKELHK